MLRILVADDNVDAAESLALLLGMVEGHEVRVVHNGSAAIEVSRQWRPDAVILDLEMPLLDGFAACAAIRASSPCSVMIAFTGHGGQDWKNRAFEAGFDAYFLKGMEFGRLRAAIRDAVTAQRSIFAVWT